MQIGLGLGLTNQQNLQYYQQIIDLIGRSNINVFTPYWDESGAAAIDIVNARNGTYGAILPTLADVVSPNHRKAPTWAGASGGVSYPTAARNAFNGAEGFLVHWVNPTQASATDAANHRMWRIVVDGNNLISGQLTTADNTINFDNKFGGTGHGYVGYFTRPTWWCAIATWSASASKFRLYANAGLLRNDDTALGTWSGTPFITAGTSDSLRFLGNMSDFILGNRYLTFAEVKRICDLAGGFTKRFTILGDSIAGGGFAAINWVAYFAAQYTGASLGTLNRSVASATLMSGGDAQVAAAANDDAGLILNQLGGNDDDAGNMTAFQAKMESQLGTLKDNHPRADIYWINIFPRWTDTGGGTEVDKSHLRAAGTAACAAQGVTVLDGYTGPGIAAEDTLDGTHFDSAANTKATNWLLGLGL